MMIETLEMELMDDFNEITSIYINNNIIDGATKQEMIDRCVKAYEESVTHYNNRGYIAEAVAMLQNYNETLKNDYMDYIENR